MAREPFTMYYRESDADTYYVAGSALVSGPFNGVIYTVPAGKQLTVSATMGTFLGSSTNSVQVQDNNTTDRGGHTVVLAPGVSIRSDGTNRCIISGFLEDI